jgi:mannobiose 2-epimerase
MTNKEKPLSKITREAENIMRDLQHWAGYQLNDIIMPFWMKYMPDDAQDGFKGLINNDLSDDPGAPKGLILNARILWAFSAVFNHEGNEAHLAMAKRAADYINKFFYDSEFGGYYWMLDSSGEMKQGKKQIYAQAFVLYAFTEYFVATQDNEYLEKAKEIFKLIEQHAFDNNGNGYLEAFDRNWQPVEDLRLSEKDMNVAKTMNTHLHVLEAYTSLFRVWPDPQLSDRISNLIDIFLQHFIRKDDYHFELFFDEDWNSKSTEISYGHDIEGSWLLYEAAEVLKDEDRLTLVADIAVKMTDAGLKGLNQDKGLDHETHRGVPSNGQTEWWAQAEAIVGCLNTFQLTGDEYYLQVAEGLKNFTEKYFVDHNSGEWYFRLDPERKPILSYEKAGFWKCPYHNSRMCLEINRRITLIHQ